MGIKKRVKAIDLFCGVGGLTHGLKRAGIDVIAGFDNDESCRFSYTENNDADFINANVAEMKGKNLTELYDSRNVQIKVLVGCAPCQPFSKYSNNSKNKQRATYWEKWGLLHSFARLIEEVRPEIVSMENVPELVNETVFEDFKETLIKEGYYVSYKVVYAPDYGVPQNRSRLILLASQLGPIELIAPTHSKDEYQTVRDAIGMLEPIGSGEVSKTDQLHMSSALRGKNIMRIRQSIPGGSWEDWDEELLAECHKKDTGKTYKSVYGRMQWDKVSPTITTQFNGFGNGRFGHPEQDRALSIREGAILQSFPNDYKFVEGCKKIKIGALARHIGNAVPPELGRIIGVSINEHVEKEGRHQ